MQELYVAVEKSLRKFFGKRGDQIVQDNQNAAKRGYEAVFEVPDKLILTAA